MSESLQVKELTELITRCLQEGSSIEIDGLGNFELQDNEVVFRPSNRIRVFLAHAQEDRPFVERIYYDLQRAGFEPWMDSAKLLPGQNWPRAIQREIELADFVLINFSHHSVAKRGYFQYELRHALEVSDRVPLDEIFLVPVRFSDCEVPIEVARKTQYIDLFPDYEAGMRAIINMMLAQIRKRQKKRERRRF
jgi:hypothetical protein